VLTLQFLVVGIGLLISRNLYTNYSAVIALHSQMRALYQSADNLADRSRGVLHEVQAPHFGPDRLPALADRLNSITASAQAIAAGPVEMDAEKGELQKALGDLAAARKAAQQASPGGDARDLAASISELQKALKGVRDSSDRLDEENLSRIGDVRQISFWNNLCEAIACLLMAISFGWAVHLYRHLRKEELARFGMERELSAERRALEERVRVRTAALESEVRERQRVEKLNRGRNRVLEMVADNAPIDGILQVLANSLAEYRSTWACVVHTLDAGMLKMTASSGLSEKVKEHLGSIVADYSGAPESMALSSGKPFMIEDLGAERRTWSELLRANGLLSVWSTPFFAPDSYALGTITVYTLLKWNPSEGDLEMLEMARNLASLVLERSRMQTQLVDHAYHDSLTGLPNRRLGRDRLSRATSRAERNRSQTAVLWIDLNRFKQINDRYGHPVGDAVLQKAAQRLSGRLRTCDTLARMGGDEFMAIIEDVASREDAEELASDLLEILAFPMQIGELEIAMTGSIGISLYPEDGRTVDNLAQHADQAMYAAKFGGCGMLSFSPEMDQVPAQRRDLEEEMKQALEIGGFRVVYQPLCQPDGTLDGFEALLRFESPSLGAVPPSRFIPIAEETQLIVPLGEWVLRQVCEQNRAWQRAGLTTVPIAVNISAVQFSRDDFSDTVAGILAETGESGVNLVLELTESIVMHDFEESARQMKRLKRLGMRIAIDDFGTGYSSLSYLHRLPIDVLKIDGSFMEHLNAPEGTRPIVEAVLSMGHMLGLRVVAEGVETAAQLRTLEECGCRVIQGYYFSKPAEHEVAAGFLRRGELEGGLKALSGKLFCEPDPFEETAFAG